MSSAESDARLQATPQGSPTCGKESNLLMALSEELAALEGGTARSRDGEARRLLEEAFARVEQGERGERSAA